jgi:hypothetical protein
MTKMLSQPGKQKSDQVGSTIAAGYSKATSAWASTAFAFAAIAALREM